MAEIDENSVPLQKLQEGLVHSHPNISTLGGRELDWSQWPGYLSEKIFSF